MKSDVINDDGLLELWEMNYMMKMEEMGKEREYTFGTWHLAIVGVWDQQTSYVWARK